MRKSSRVFVFAIAAMFAMGSISAQQPVKQPAQQHSHDGGHHHHHDGQHHHHDGQHPHHHQAAKPAELQYNADGIETTLAAAFPSVKSIKAEGKWTAVYDAKKKLIGYAVYSKPASNDVRGYAGETPLLITFTTKKVISGVYLLPNAETPRFVKHVEDAGLYTQWNGLSVKQALKKKVDTVSGATFTSRAVIQSLQKALEQL